MRADDLHKSAAPPRALPDARGSVKAREVRVRASGVCRKYGRKDEDIRDARVDRETVIRRFRTQKKTGPFTFGDIPGTRGTKGH